MSAQDLENEPKDASVHGIVATLSRSRFKEALNSSIVLIALVALIAVFSALSPYFLSIENFFQILLTVSVVGILAIGQTYVIATAGIDLSQGAIVGFSGVVAALLMTSGQPVFLAVVAGIAAGLLVGFLNGLLVTVLNLPPFIATLGTLNAVLGTALLITGGQPVFGLDPAFTQFGSTGILGIFPNVALVMLTLAVAFHILLSRTRFGRYTYAIGSNPQSARLSGLRVNRHLMNVYLISGFTGGVAGLVLLAWTNSGAASAGSNEQLNAIAAVVIGGGSLFGGEGTVWGSLIGALLMAVLANGSQLLGVSSYWQLVLLGVVVVGAVFADNFRQRR